ncbi:Glucose-6-phosphate isomerase [Frankliniella fusca]|uniref:Glucose-6-phosphate isomerase n=1 Tax=Frankliniella fusca TaxID=407009 RepID=A0AAE1I4F6_9NEOP|nr:Glucose-6-phosphate isomerase [Frankliniella fusca]
MEECIEMCEMYQKWIGNGENENTVYAIGGIFCMKLREKWIGNGGMEMGPTNLKLKKPGFMSGVFLSMKALRS